MLIVFCRKLRQWQHSEVACEATARQRIAVWTSKTQQCWKLMACCFTPARVAYDPSATPWSRIDPKPTVSVNLVAHGLKKRKAQCMTDVYIDVGPSWSQVCIMLNISRFLLHPDNSIMVGFCEDHGSRCGYTKTTNEDFLHFCYMKTVRIKSGIS